MVQRFVEKKMLGLNPNRLRSIHLHNIRPCVLIQMVDPVAAVGTAAKLSMAQFPLNRADSKLYGGPVIFLSLSDKTMQKNTGLGTLLNAKSS